MIKVVIGKRLVVLVFQCDFIDKKLDFQNRFPYDLGGGIKVYVSTPSHNPQKNFAISIFITIFASHTVVVYKNNYYE